MRIVVLSGFWLGRRVGDAQLAATLATLRRAGKQVFVTDDVPSFPFDPFECKYRQALLEPARCSAPVAEFRALYDGWYPGLAASVRSVPGVRILHTARWFCGARTCDMARGSELLYRDGNHLNLNGSRYVAAQLLAHDPAFAAAVSTR